ncbi:MULTISPECIES: efflux RND transporter periplasmic adaptor subunit [Olivibacter]|uniref:Efflux transporter, RND family, MFP subunit n=2 Tax=Sphingobacteriaceae TaxID=84566 RepID=F4C4E9_SPHS2|nr:efflux RND transporter periplasmic adaptor subunit [Olivibacter sp. UJ_SKK_5.1]MDX3914307.1 efflux RND transporter periplasmic adaptor subunit [Pseudosphingobacterium sp.]
MRKSIIFISFIIALGVSSCNSSKESNGGQEEENIKKTCLNDDLKKIISTETIRTSVENKEILKLTGSVSYDEDKVYKFVPLLSGVVQHVGFSLGDYVKKGQILLEISSTDLNDMVAGLNEAELKLKIAQRQLSATQNLYADGVASDKEILEAQADVSNAQSEIKKTKASLDIFGGNIEKGVLVIRSKNDGYIVEKNIVNGQQIEAGGEPLFVIGDLSRVWVKANVYTGNISSVRRGQSVNIETTAYPNKHFNGVINRISNVVDPNERVLKAIIELDNQDLLLRPEMMATIDVYLDHQVHSMAIPHNAVIFDNEAYHLIKYNNDCDLEVVDFTPSYEDNHYYYVSDDHLHDGDRIIGKNSLLIYNRLIGR